MAGSRLPVAGTPVARLATARGHAQSIRIKLGVSPRYSPYETSRVSQLHIALFTPGYPYVDAALRAAELARRHNAPLSRSAGEPLSLRRDQFARWFLESSAATHALLLEGEVVPPADVVERLLALDAPVAAAVYPQWSGDRLVTNVQAGSDGSWSQRVPRGVFPVRRCLLGCVLVRRDALAAMASPWFLSIVTDARFIEDDEWFCQAVRRAGLEILCDGGTVCSSYRQGIDLLELVGERMHMGPDAV
jgi:hypothetical protein